MIRLKYVIFNSVGLETPIVFPQEILHTGVTFCGGIYGSPATPIAAGFCEMDDEGVCCFGESISLKLKSRPEEDAMLIRKFYQGEES